ncbi:hypothetical protein ACHAQI_010001 [Fusarium lateritium]
MFECMVDPADCTLQQCAQQSHSIDCGSYANKLAQICASINKPDAPYVIPNTRDKLAFELLTSSAAIIPSCAHQGLILALYTKVKEQLSTLRDRLADWDLPFSPVKNSNTITLDHHE